jgi:hypothetical protein
VSAESNPATGRSARVWPWASVLFLVSALLASAFLGRQAGAAHTSASLDVLQIANSKAARVLLVSPGQRVSVGAGSSLWLTPTQMCLDSGGSAECGPAINGAVLSFSFGGSPVTGIYSGVDAQAILIGDGHDVRAAVAVRLRSHPGFTAYALSVGASESGCSSNPWQVIVYNATGRAIASLKLPKETIRDWPAGANSACSAYAVGD